MTSRMNRLWSSPEAREWMGLLLVVASMLFVGVQIRQANIQARAASYQAIGIATAELHGRIKGGSVQLAVDARYRAENLTNWLATDWEKYARLWLESFRLFETLLLQVEQGLLSADALELLGWSHTPDLAWNSPGFVCLWPRFQIHMGSSLRALLEEAKPKDVYDCSHIDVEAVMKGQGRGRK